MGKQEKKEEYLSTSEAGDILGISRVAVFKRIKNGKLPANKVGGNYIIKKSDLTGVSSKQASLPSEIRDRLNEFIKSRSYMVWYVDEPENLSVESIVEHTLNYGDWEDVQDLIDILGIERVASIFDHQIKESNRINYRPEIVNYFKLFFKKHAPASQ